MAKLIMAIDNDKSLLELYETLLTDAGYNVSLRVTVPKEIKIIEEMKPSLLITGLMFGEKLEGKKMEGFYLIQKLRLNTATQQLPIILCTSGEGFIKNLENELAEAQVKVVLKPFGLDEFLETVKQLISES